MEGLWDYFDGQMAIAQFRHIKIQPETINITERLRIIKPYKLYNLFPGASK